MFREYHRWPESETAAPTGKVWDVERLTMRLQGKIDLALGVAGLQVRQPAG